jgi:hypothetical protein
VLPYLSVEARNAHRIPVRAGEAALPGLRHNIRDYRPEREEVPGVSASQEEA